MQYTHFTSYTRIITEGYFKLQVQSGLHNLSTNWT